LASFIHVRGHQKPWLKPEEENSYSAVTRYIKREIKRLLLIRRANLWKLLQTIAEPHIVVLYLMADADIIGFTILWVTDFETRSAHWVHVTVINPNNIDRHARLIG
jgi:hypothetical protein